MKTLNSRNLWIVILLLFLQSCSNVTETAKSEILKNETTTLTEKVNETEKTTTPSKTAKLDSTTITPSPNIRSNPVPDLTNTLPSAQPTWTPLTTLSMEEARVKVIDLLTNNAGCELPCWWGVMPGRTKWEEAEHYFSSFIDKIVKTELKSGTKNKRFASSLVFSLPNESSDRISGFLVIDNIVQEISAEPGTELRYQISNLLSLHGKPEEIILEAMPITMDLKPWVSFYLYYPEQGIIALYDGEATIEGEKIKMCPKGIGPRLILVPPGSMSLQEMIKISYDAPYLLPSINENPGWSIERFYEEMKEPGACFVVEPTG